MVGLEPPQNLQRGTSRRLTRRSLSTITAFHHCRKEPIARLHTRQRPQEVPAEQRVEIIPHQFSACAQSLQLLATVAELNPAASRSTSSTTRFVLFALQRASGVHRAPAGRELLQRGAQDANLPRVQIVKVLRSQPPLDLRIARQRSRTRARHIGQHAIEAAWQWQLQGVGVDDFERWRRAPACAADRRDACVAPPQ